MRACSIDYWGPVKSNSIIGGPLLAGQPWKDLDLVTPVIKSRSCPLGALTHPIVPRPKTYILHQDQSKLRLTWTPSKPSPAQHSLEPHTVLSLGQGESASQLSLASERRDLNQHWPTVKPAANSQQQSSIKLKHKQHWDLTRLDSAHKTTPTRHS